MLNKFSFLLLIITYSLCINDKVHTIKFEDNESNEKIITLCIGNKQNKPANCLPFRFSSCINKLYVFDTDLNPNCFNSENSDTFKFPLISISSYIEDQYFQGKIGTDDIYFKNYNIKLKAFNFVLIKRGYYSNSYCGVFGFNFDESSFLHPYDILQNLYNSHQINIQTAKFDSNKIVLGERIKYEKSINIKWIEMIRGVEWNNVYGFKISSILTVGKMNRIIWQLTREITGVFGISRNYILCDTFYYQFLINVIFSVFIKRKECIIKDENNFERILCKQKVIDSLSNERIYFFIGDWSIRYKFKEFFGSEEDEYNYKEFMIGHSYIYSSQWVFGNIFLKDKVISFDKDNERILVEKRT